MITNVHVFWMVNKKKTAAKDVGWSKSDLLNYYFSKKDDVDAVKFDQRAAL